METSTINAGNTTGTHTGTFTELIGTLTRADIKFLQVALSTDKTREQLTHGVIRYSTKCNSFIVASTDTHRLHVVRAGKNGNLEGCKNDIMVTVDVNSIARQMSAFKSDRLDIFARISTTGEYIALEFIAQNVPAIQNAIITNVGAFPNIESVMLESLDSKNVGLKGCFDGTYISDACTHLVNKKENAMRLTFWQAETMRPAYVLDSQCSVNAYHVELGYKFALIMPMQII